MDAVLDTAQQNAELLNTLKLHIGMGLNDCDVEDNSIDIQIRIAEIDAEFKDMIRRISAENAEDFDEEKVTRLMGEKAELQKKLKQIDDAKQKQAGVKSRLDEIFTILESLKNHPLTYDDEIVRQILECVIVESKEKIKVIFVGGLEKEVPLE